MDLQDDRVGRAAKDQVHLVRTGMLGGVVHGLLRDAVEFLLGTQRQIGFVAELG
jgi:hypothetical protein